MSQAKTEPAKRSPFSDSLGPQPPGPSRLYPYLHLPKTRKNLISLFEGLKDKYGNIVLMKTLSKRRLYFINEPELIRQVLVTQANNFTKDRILELSKEVMLGEGLLTSEGKFHRRQRKLSAPAFHRKRIELYAESMTDYAQRTARTWENGATVDMDHEMMRLTLAVVAKTLFDAEVDNNAAEIGEALNTIMGYFPMMLGPFAKLRFQLSPIRRKKFFAARKIIDDTIHQMIRERRSSGKDHGDLLSMLLSAQDEDDGSQMTAEQVRDEAVTLFLAGHETTANALTWAWHLLSKHPEQEQRLHEEVDRVLQKNLSAYESYQELIYTRKVFAETMRLYPPAHTLGRRAIQAFELGGYKLPAGAGVAMSPFIIQRDPRFWEEPLKFQPERWGDEPHKKRDFTYFPFGGGPRICIGQAFAWMEGVLLLAHLSHKWQARMVPNHPVEMRPLITLRPRHGMQMTLHKR